MFDLISTDVCHKILILFHRATIILPLFAANDSFTLANIKGTCPHLAPLLPEEWESCHLVKIPLCVPISYGVWSLPCMQRVH